MQIRSEQFFYVQCNSITETVAKFNEMKVLHYMIMLLGMLHS